MKTKLWGVAPTLNVKRFLLAAAMSVACLSSAHATNYRFFCTNQSDPAINPNHDGVFVAITYGTAQGFDVVHTISRQLYNRQVQYRVTSITQPAPNSYFWEGFMLKDPNVIMTGHLWQNEGVWMYTENQRFTDGRPPKMATPPVVCHNTVDLRQAVERDKQPTVPPGSEPSNPQHNFKQAEAAPTAPMTPEEAVASLIRTTEEERECKRWEAEENKKSTEELFMTPEQRAWGDDLSCAAWKANKLCGGDAAFETSLHAAGEGKYAFGRCVESYMGPYREKHPAPKVEGMSPATQAVYDLQLSFDQRGKVAHMGQPISSPPCTLRTSALNLGFSLGDAAPQSTINKMGSVA